MQLISDSSGRESNCNARPTVEHIYIMAVRPVDIVHIIAWKASSLQDFIQIKHQSFSLFTSSSLSGSRSDTV